MRVCPKCEYVDPSYWRHSRYSYFIDFTEYENWLAMGFPEIEKGGKWEDKLYVYRRMKKHGNVERKAKIDYGYQWNVPMEHHKPRDLRKCWKREKADLRNFIKKEDLEAQSGASP